MTNYIKLVTHNGTEIIYDEEKGKKIADQVAFIKATDVYGKVHYLNPSHIARLSEYEPTRNEQYKIDTGSTVDF